MAQQHTPAAGSGKPFRHEPKPPVVPTSHPYQRYFSGSESDYSVRVAQKKGTDSSYTVYRNAARDDVDVQLTVNAVGFDARTCLAMSADQLEAFAARLLDAAHDLRTHSAQSLGEQRIVEEVPA
jgi:hypothetical protein